MPDAVAKFLDANQTWVGVVIGVLATIIVGAIGIAFSRSRQAPRLVYQARAIPLISNDLRQLLPTDTTVVYKGHPVERLTKLQLVVWNSGGAILEGTAVVEQLRWIFQTGGEILDIKKIRGTSIGNNVVVSTTATPNIINLDFDYLDPGDGALYEVLHTSPNLVPNGGGGWMKGVPRGLESWGTLKPRFRWSRKDFLWLIGTLVLVYLAVVAVVGTMANLDVAGWIGVSVLVLAVWAFVMGIIWYSSDGSLVRGRFGIGKGPPMRLVPLAEAWDYAMARRRRAFP